MVYTFVDLRALHIERDQTFIEDMVTKLEHFYETYLKPAILEKYVYRGYEKIFITKEQ